jgi:tetratricopeptide (TPR) repeat protein
MQRCKLLKFLPLLLLLLASCNRDPKVQAQRTLEQANKFFARAKYKEAAIMYKRALQKDMRFGEAYYRLALTELKLGSYGDAFHMLRRAVELQPNNTDAVTKLADLYLLASTQQITQRKQYLDEVKDLSDKLMAQNPDSFDGHRLKGQLALLNRDAKGAIEEFEKANRVKPYQSDLVLVYFQALILDNRFPDAEKLANNLIEKEKAYAPMYDMLYTQYMRRGDVTSAEGVLKRKVANNPTQARYIIQLAQHYFFTSRKPEMEAVMQQLNDDKKFPDGHLQAGDFYFVRLKDFESARAQYEAAVKAFPKDKALYQKRLVELFATTGKSQLANDTLATILKENPKDSEAIGMRAALMLSAGNRDQINVAANDLQALVTKTPENHVFRYNLARALVAKGEIEPARLQLEEVIKLRSDLVLPRILLAKIYLVERQPTKALKEADGVLAIDRNNLEAHLTRSSALLGMSGSDPSAMDKARAELDAISKAYPQNAQARYQVGLLALEDRDYKKAEQIFAEMYKANPNDTRGLAGVTESLAAQGRMGDAIKETQKAVEREPQRKDLKLVLAKYYTRSQRYDEAIGLYQMLVQQDPRSADLLFQLAETQRLKGDLNSAVETFRRCSQTAPSDTMCLTQLGLILDATGKREQAKPIYEQILKIKPDQGVALNNLAFIKAEEGVDLDQALSMSQRARQGAMANQPEVSDTLGWIYIKKNLSEDAVRIFKDLTAKVPANPTFHYHYGMALLQKGDKPAAKREFETALANKPSKGDEEKIKDLLLKM